MSSSNSDQSSAFRRRFDRASLGGVIIAGIACAVLVAVAFLASRNAPVATSGITDRLPLPAVSADAGCENFGRYWTETSGADIDPVPLELFSNCRIQDDGTWIAADSMYGAAPLDESVLTSDQRAELAQLRTAIAAQIGELEATLPQSVRRIFGELHTGENNAVVGHFREGMSWGSYRTRYARIVNAFMLDPNNSELASFIGWTMARKIDGYAAFRRECLANADAAMLHGACKGMEDNLSIRYAPLPWDLRDPALLDTWYYETFVKPTQTEG